MYTFALQSPIGLLFVAVTERGVRRIHVLSSGHDTEGAPWVLSESPDAEPGSRTPAEEHVAAEVESQLRDYFESDRRAFDLPLDIDSGSPFQRQVWESIRRIPYGEVASYADIAVAAGAPGAFRAAGSACGANPIAVVTPCHRVIASGGRLGGYGLGIQNKVWLLQHEGIECAGTSKDSRVNPAQTGPTTPISSNQSTKIDASVLIQSGRRL